jgi:hypothetical protein
MATATKRAMTTAMRLAGDKESNGNCGKINGNGVKGDGGATATRTMETRVAAE